MAKVGRKVMPEKLASEKAKLLAELERIEELEKKLEQETNWKNEGKSYVIDQLVALFEGFSYRLQREKEKFESSTQPYDHLVAEFIDSRMKDFSHLTESALNRASKKQTIEQFQKAVAKTLSSTASKSE